jgi:transcriptional regulator with XRE-family HTH domain
MPATAELTLDAEAMYEEIDRQRRHRRLRRKEVAAELGVAPCTISTWGAGGGVSADVALRICIWTGRSLEDFIKKDGTV